MHANKMYVPNMSLLARYGGLAGYSALTAVTASVAGQVTSDLVNDGQLTNADSYLRNATPAVATAIGVSALVSAYSYATWDKYSLQQRAEIMRGETGIYATYDPTSTDDMNTYPSEDGFGRSTTVTYSKTGLYSKSTARVEYAHEQQHISDFERHILNDNEDIGGAEIRAYRISQSMASRSFVPIRFQLGWAQRETITPLNILASFFR